MKIITKSLAAICILAQQAAATYDWEGAKSFSNPSNTYNKCTPDQKAGFDWSDLPLGGFGSYKGFDFEGFACSDSGDNRSLTTRSSAKAKFIEGRVNKNAQAAPKIACSTDKSFSITDIEVSVSYDTDIDFVYDMPDGSTCKHTESCSKDGTGVKNTQCGGATSVSFLQVPQKESDLDCHVRIHSVGFDCQPASTITSSAVAGSTSAAAVSSLQVSSMDVTTSSEVVLASSAAASVESHTSAEATSLPSTSELPSSASSVHFSTTTVAPISLGNLSVTYSSTDESPATPLTAPGGTDVPMSTSTVWSTFTSITYACSSDVPDCADSSVKVVTMTTAVSTTTCPVTIEASSTPETSAAVPETSAPAPQTSHPSRETSAPPPETSHPGPETSASAPETSKSGPDVPAPAPETKTAPAESNPASVLPESTPATEPSTALTEAPATVEAFSASSETTAATLEIVTTEIVYTSTSSCPVTVTSTSGSSTTVTTSLTMTQTVVTSTVTVCTGCTEAPPTTLTPAPSTSALVTPATYPGSSATATEDTSAMLPTSVLPDSASSALPMPSNAPCPEVLPSCLNTWLSLVPQCTSNSDASCYCPSKQFTDAVIGCVQAWGASADEMSAALSYFTGICAASIPQNLAIITAVPSTISLCPTVSVPTAMVATATIATGLSQTITQSYALTSLATSVQSTPIEPVQAPVTIISYTQTLNPASGGSSSVITTAVTVPQVSFITGVPATPASSESGVAPQANTSVGLIPAAITTTIPTASGAYNGTKANATSSGVVLFTGAAVGIDINGVAAAVVAAFASIFAFLI